MDEDVMSFVLAWIIGMFLGWLIVTLITRHKKASQEYARELGWVKIRDFGNLYTTYCSESGCMKGKIKEPIDFGFCEDHRGRYWKKQPLPAKTKQPEEYQAYGWME